MAKGSKKKGKKSKKVKPITDGLSPSEMSKGELLGHIQRLQAEVEREIRERDEFLYVIKKRFQLWDYLNGLVRDAKAKVESLNDPLDESITNKDEAEDDCTHKIFHMKEEQNFTLANMRIANLEQVAHAHRDAWNIQDVFKDNLNEAEKSRREAHISFSQIIRGTMLKHTQALSDLRKDFSYQLRLVENATDRRLFGQNDLENDEFSRESRVFTRVKDVQMKSVVSTHEQQMKEMQEYFAELNEKNVIVVRHLEKEITRNRGIESRLSHDVQDLKNKLANLRKPMKGWQEQIHSWEREHEHDDTSHLLHRLKKAETDLEKCQRYQRMIECSNEALLQRTQVAEKDRKNLKTSFTHAIIDIQQKSSFKRLVTSLKTNSIKKERKLYDC